MNKGTLRSLRKTVQQLRERETALKKITGQLRQADRNGAVGVVLDHILSLLEEARINLSNARMHAEDAEYELSKTQGED